MFRTVMALWLMTNLSFSVSAQTCIRGDCTNGFGTVVYGKNSRYTGEFTGGLRQGRGIFYYANGNKYLGEWVRQKMQGEGKLIFANGNVYIGHFKMDRMYGKGTMEFKSGDRYTGEWVDDMPNGKGSYYFLKGDRYEGEFLNGKIEGEGTLVYKDGSRYKGHWKANKREGYGELHTSDGKQTAGQWQMDKLVKVLDYSKTEETVAENLPVKQNQDPPPNSNAQPTIDEKENIPTNIPVAETKPVESVPSNAGLTEENLPNCNEQFCKSGKGILNYADGSKYIGEFVEGEPRGKGICRYANGDRYEGLWAEHAPNGEGVMYFTSGLVYGAIWDHGTAKQQLYSKQEFRFNDKIIAEVDKEVKIWAVIIGIARYEHMPSLKYSDDDAYKIYAFLKSPEGGALEDNQIRVLIDEDATRQQILVAINEIFMKADENDVIMLYYSGHGLEGTFLPIDYDGFKNAIQHEEITQIFSKSRAKHKVCYIDACHSGSLLASKGPFSSSLMYFYDELDKESGGTAFLMSSKSKEYSLEDGGLRQGVFSHFLIRGIKGEADENKNKTITIRELFDFVSKKVKEYTGNVQTPMLAGEYNENMPVAFIRQK